jgi:parallel beta-helix repeat protein
MSFISNRGAIGFCLAVLAAHICSCGQEKSAALDSGGLSSTGGFTSTGGAPSSSGGSKGTGGAQGTGGLAAGGNAGTVTVSSSGGVAGKGGAAGATSTAGGGAAGGVAGPGTGGAPGTGGQTTSGGATGTRTGGAGGGVGSGGASVVDSGAGGVRTGGAGAVGPGTGGVQSTGGAGAVGTGGAPASKTYYVTTTGKSSSDGSSFTNAMDYPTAFAAVKGGELVLLQAGTYKIPYATGSKNTLTFSKSGSEGKPIRIESYDNGRAVFDFQFAEQDWVQDGYGFALTGSYYAFKGIDITRAGYQGVYVTGQHNTLENCTFHHNRNTGLEINEGGAYTTVRNCDAYRNYDPKKNGSMSDGFGPKQKQGPGNKFIGCRSWENGDDGYDAFDSPETVTFEGCWAFRNGVDVWNYGSFAGNGNGFKVGGNGALANHKLTNCVAWGQPSKGFDQNNNTGGVTIYNSTSYKNKINFGFGGDVASGQKHDFKNNISLGGQSADSIANATTATNAWNSGLSVSEADFISVDTSLASAPRNPDGSLPANDLFRLAKGSKLVDAGTKVGLPYSGAAPDLGAFETAE